MADIKKLKEMARSFRSLLENNAKNGSDAEHLLIFLTPLFEDISEGKVMPPKRYEYRLVLGKDSQFYQPENPLSEAEAQFVAVLEDWESQAWYQKGKKGSTE